MLAGGTTVLGLLGLGFSGFPGVREMSVFAVAGVGAGLLSVVLIAPLLGPAMRPTHALRASAAFLERVLVWVQGHRRVAYLMLAAALVVGVAGISRVRWQNDMNALNLPNPALLAEDGRVRARVGDQSDGRFVVTTGRDVEEALRRSEGALADLASLKKGGALGGFASVHNLLWSKNLQERNLAELGKSPDVAKRLGKALEDNGFVPEMFEEFGRELDGALHGKAEAPLTFDILKKSPLEPMISPFVLELGDKAAVVTHLSKVKDPARVAEVLEKHEGVHYFDQRATIDALYVDVRSRTVELIALGLLGVAGVVFARYRKLRPTIAAVLPACVAGITSIGLLSLFGAELNLLHVISLLLVLSMGEDYGVFLVDAVRTGGKEATPAAMMSIALACLSTVLSFGLLGLSDVPALKAMGQTVALGDILSLLFSPVAAVLVTPDAEAGSAGSNRPGEVSA
jgi:predicted exporter